VINCWGLADGPKKEWSVFYKPPLRLYFSYLCALLRCLTSAIGNSFSSKRYRNNPPFTYAQPETIFGCQLHNISLYIRYKRHLIYLFYTLIISHFNPQSTIMPRFIMLFMYFYNYWFSRRLTFSCLKEPSPSLTGMPFSFKYVFTSRMLYSP